jgi:parvulin-like peptidyl-prolyl isomerase
MKQLRVFSVLVLSLLSVLLVAACGSGDSESVPDDAVAVVAGQQIPREQFDALLEQTKAGYKQQGRDVPKAGTPEYTTLKTNIVQYLVQRAQFEEKAKELGITITDKQIDDELAKIKKDFFQGNDAKMQAQLKKQNITLDSLKRDIRAKLVQEKLYAKVTGDVTVTDKEIQDYYDQHKDLYGQPESRDVRHILVDKKQLADKIYAQLKDGASFAQLAKKYSKDPGSAAQGGKLTISKGQTVPEFDKLAFDLKTGELGQPVKTQYGWHVIEALSAVKAAKTQPFTDVKDQIRAQLLETKKSDAMTKWVNGVKKELGDKTSYQVGFEPPAQQNTSTATQ